MNEITEHWNDTVSLSHIIMPLISMLSTHFLVNSFTLISDMDLTFSLRFVKIASKFYIQIDSGKIIDNSSVVQIGNYTNYENKGYIVLGKPDLNILTMATNKKPRMVIAIGKMEEKDLIFFSKLEIPPTIAFFVVTLAENSKYFSSEITGRCLRLYKPMANYPLRVLPTVYYGGLDKPQWIWENEKTNWNSFAKEVRNMTGVPIRIALVSHLDERAVLNEFWTGRNSFFWRALEEHLHYQSIVIYQRVSLKEVRTVADVYRKMLQTAVDGLGVLPVITSERTERLRYVITGIDQKYHLLVRTPQYAYSWHSMFKPLANESWICLGIAILLISITLWITTFQEKPPVADLSSCCLMIFGFACSQGCDNMPRSISGCVVCYTALLFSILIYQFYTSNFYSLLSTKEVSLPFTSLEDFMAKRTHKLYVHPETALYSHIVNAKNGPLKRLWDILKNDPAHQLKSEVRKKSFDHVCKGGAAILGLPYQTIHYKELTCKLVPVDSGYVPGNTITPLRKKFPFISQFQFVHMRLKEGGMTQKFKNQFFTIDQQHKTKTDVTNDPITMVHVAFLFVLLVASVILSLLILCVEIMVTKAVKRKSIKNGRKSP